MNIESLGITKDEIIDRIVERAAEGLVREDRDYWDDTLMRKVSGKIAKILDELSDKIAEDTIRPILKEKIDGLVLQRTNEWGEKKGQTMGFTEYIVSRFESYIGEEVAYNGQKPDWTSKAKQTRVAWMIDQHLQYSIDGALKKALVDANSQIADGIAKSVKVQLADLATRITVKAKG